MDAPGSAVPSSASLGPPSVVLPLPSSCLCGRRRHRAHTPLDHRQRARTGLRAFVMASRFDVRSFRDVPRFFLRSLAAWKQVKGAPGAYGATLIAQPLKRTFWTLSAWEDKRALSTYAKTEPHRSIMTGLRSTTSGSVFTFWEHPGLGTPPRLGGRPATAGRSRSAPTPPASASLGTGHRPA